MKFQITSKLEVNLLDSTKNAEFVSDFLVKNRIPVIVASPEYIAHLVAYRAARRGQYKIICALDFPGGTNFAMDKIYRSNRDLASADGYDILLTNRRNEIESNNEMKTLHSFFKMNNSFVDIRWCLGALTRSDNDITKILASVKKYPPSYIRTDNHLVTHLATLEKHKEIVAKISEAVPFPIKVSGNIDLEMIQALSGSVSRFDVSIDQAASIIKEIESAEAEIIENDKMQEV